MRGPCMVKVRWLKGNTRGWKVKVYQEEEAENAGEVKQGS